MSFCHVTFSVQWNIILLTLHIFYPLFINSVERVIHFVTEDLLSFIIVMDCFMQSLFVPHSECFHHLVCILHKLSQFFIKNNQTNYDFRMTVTLFMVNLWVQNSYFSKKKLTKQSALLVRCGTFKGPAFLLPLILFHSSIHIRTFFSPDCSH